MVRNKMLNYGLATLMFVGSYTLPMVAKAEVTQKSVKQQFFDTIVDYARKQGLKINRIDANDVEIKEKVVTNTGEPAQGILNLDMRKIEVQDSKLEDVATVSIHELTHREKYDPKQETELWFEKIPYILEKKGDIYIATPDTTKLGDNSKISQYLQTLILKQECVGHRRVHALYDPQGNKLTELDVVKIIGKDDSVVRVRTANYPISGVQGKFYYQEESNVLYYIPSEIMGFYNEIIARIYEQIFSGYYSWRSGYYGEYTREMSTLGKSLAYLTSKDSNLTWEQKKISQSAEEVYTRLNEEALLEVIEKTVQVGGKAFKEAMEDLQDEDFAKSVSLASIILTKDDFQTMLDVYDEKGKEEVKKLLTIYTKEFEETKSIGTLKESDIIRAYLRKFNLNDKEVEHVLRNTKHKNFDDLFKSREKIKHIEYIKQVNLEGLLQQFKEHEKAITKGL